MSLTVSLTTSRQLQARLKSKLIEDRFKRVVLPLAAGRSSEIKDNFLDLVNARNIPLVTTEKITIEDHEFLCFRKIFSPLNEAAIAVRIEPYGNDLIVESRHYECVSGFGANKPVGWVLILVGLPLCMAFGIGLIPIFMGVGLIRAANAPRLSGAQQEEAEAFRTAILECRDAAIE